MQTAYSAITASAVTALYAKTTMKTSPASRMCASGHVHSGRTYDEGQIGPPDLRANVPRLLTVRSSPVVLRPAPHPFPGGRCRRMLNRR